MKILSHIHTFCLWWMHLRASFSNVKHASQHPSSFHLQNIVPPSCLIRRKFDSRELANKISNLQLAAVPNRMNRMYGTHTLESQVLFARITLFMGRRMVSLSILIIESLNALYILSVIEPSKQIASLALTSWGKFHPLPHSPLTRSTIFPHSLRFKL